ncbi:glutaredoxin family protein [Hydrocarboniphaga sp.]|uniref:glutaredoxin family protein n=1 Tax=Hydrocarboniphaga sp. TaxID=2033016 RepID=UPI003D0AA291
MALLLLSRPGCHLCEQLVTDLLTTFPALATQISEADVDSREDWQRRWGLKIPVLLDAVDGEPVCSTFFDADVVAEWIRDRGI